jgi:hypothetical protein
MKFAAIISTGGRWPDGAAAQQGSVVIWSGEDDPGDTLVPRLDASGADLARICFVSEVQAKDRRPFDPSKDFPALQAAIEAIGGAALVIVDPIVSVVAGDSHKNAETRRALQPLQDMAGKLGAAILGVTHFTKGSEGRSPIDRVTGSLAFGALARVVLVAAKQQDSDDREPASRLLMRAKSNIGPDDGGFHYDLQLVPMWSRPDIIASVVSWGKPIDGNAREVLAAAETTRSDDSGALGEAKEWLADFLKDGPRGSGEVKKASAQDGHSWATIRRAKCDLGIKPAKPPRKQTDWVWELPRSAQPPIKHLAQVGCEERPSCSQQVSLSKMSKVYELYKNQIVTGVDLAQPFEQEGHLAQVAQLAQFGEVEQVAQAGSPKTGGSLFLRGDKAHDDEIEIEL